MIAVLRRFLKDHILRALEILGFRVIFIAVTDVQSSLILDNLLFFAFIKTVPMLVVLKEFLRTI